LFGSILGEVQAASEQGTLFGSNVDVLAPPQFNEAMVSGFQGIIAGDKTPEELAAELQAAWDEGTEFEATPDGASTPAP
jgi:hypothetical protein